MMNQFCCGRFDFLQPFLAVSFHNYFQMELPEIIEINMTDKKGYLTLNITFRKEGKIMLRSSLGIQKWFNLIKVEKLIYLN